MPTRFKLDENLPRAAAEVLRSAGHDVDTVLAEGLGGATDQQVSEACQREHRVLVTLDIDFADIRLFPPSARPGTWVLRPTSLSTPTVLALLRRALPLLVTEAVEGRLWVVDEQHVRIRE